MTRSPARWVLGFRVAAEMAVAASVYLAAAAVLTWPMILHIDEIVVGGGELGGWLWRYRWHFLEVDALGSAGLSPWRTAGALLALGRYPETGNILDVLLLSWPLSRVLEFPAHYNVKVLVVLVLDGLCGYALARWFVRGRLAALAAGLVAVVNPLVIQDVYGSGLRQCVLWFLLLYPILLDRAEKRGRLRDGLAAGACLGMAAAWYWFYGLFAALFTVLWLAWRLARGAVRWRALVRWFAPLVLAAALISWPFVRPYVGLGDGSSLPEMSFFLPFPRYETLARAPLRPGSYEENVLASLARTIRSSWAADWIVRPTSERALSVTVLLLGVLPALAWRRHGFWLVVFLSSWLASLGPFLKLVTETDEARVWMPAGAWVVRMPYAWLFRWVPGMGRLFAPYRLSALAIVAAVVLLACGLASLPGAGARGRLVRGIAALAAMAAILVQATYRFEVDDVPEGAFQPTRWRSPIKVSRVEVPAFYRALDPARREGIVEVPVDREQDLLAAYQSVHLQRVYRSWATRGALPPWVALEGGGEAGDRLRLLARPAPSGDPAGRALEALSRDPEGVGPEALSAAALGALAQAGGFRWLVVHERGYWLVDPRRGHLLYEAAVQRIGGALGFAPEETVEHAWSDWPGNPYDVPDGPVYVPWSAEEIALPDQEMPRRLHMAVFDLAAGGTVGGGAG